MKKTGLKHKAPGLQIIAALGLLQCITTAYATFSFNNAGNHFDALLYVTAYFAVLWILSFVLIRQAEKSAIAAHSPLNYFRDFNFMKGLALIFIGPALLFWLKVLRNYHQALDIASPYLTLISIHFIYAFLAVIAFGVITIVNIHSHFSATQKRKPSKPFITLSDALANLVWLRFFFRGNGTTLLGRSIALFSGLTYLVFLYGSLACVLIPASWNLTTIGTVQETKNMAFLFTSRSGSHTMHYCRVSLINGDSFAFNECPACAYKNGAQVTISHHPIDYLSKHANTITCEAR